MKTRISILISISVAIALLFTSSCNLVTPGKSDVSSNSEISSIPTVSPAYEDRTLIKIATLKGPTGMGMVKLFDDNENKLTANRYETLIVGTPDEIVGKISSGEIDIAAVPTNLAATLYNKTSGAVQMLAINTLGVLYILENGSTVSDISDLKGKTLYASGKGALPEFVLNYILIQNGIDPITDLTIEYKTEHSELAALAAAGSANLVLLPEPFVTSLLAQNKGFTKKLDLTGEWADATLKAGETDSVLAMGGIIVRKEFADNNKEAVDAFMEEYSKSVEFTVNNIDAAAELIVKYGIMAAVGPAKMAIPSCNIVFVDGEVMKSQIQNLYEVLFDADPKSIGGAIPGDEFYYMK